MNCISLSIPDSPVEIKRIAIIGVKGFPAFGGSARANENLMRYLKDKYRLTFYVLDSHQAKNYRSKADFVIIKSHKNPMVLLFNYHSRGILILIVFSILSR